MYYNIINNFLGYDILVFLVSKPYGEGNCKTFDKISNFLIPQVDYLIYT